MNLIRSNLMCLVFISCYFCEYNFTKQIVNKCKLSHCFDTLEKVKIIYCYVHMYQHGFITLGSHESTKWLFFVS